jgi:hypothetical protein
MHCLENVPKQRLFKMIRTMVAYFQETTYQVSETSPPLHPTLPTTSFFVFLQIVAPIMEVDSFFTMLLVACFYCDRERPRKKGARTWLATPITHSLQVLIVRRRSCEKIQRSSYYLIILLLRPPMFTPYSNTSLLYSFLQDFLQDLFSLFFCLAFSLSFS